MNKFLLPVILMAIGFGMFSCSEPVSFTATTTHVLNLQCASQPTGSSYSLCYDVELESGGQASINQEGGDYISLGRNGSIQYRMYLYFNVYGYLPYNATVTGAYVTLYPYQNHTGTVTINLHEQTSTATNTTITWNNGTYSATVLSSTNTVPGTMTPVSLEIPASLIEQWKIVSNNRGMLLRSVNEATAGSGYSGFLAREQVGNVIYNPVLTIYYTE